MTLAERSSMRHVLGAVTAASKHRTTTHHDQALTSILKTKAGKDLAISSK